MKAAGWRPSQEGNLQPEEPGAQGRKDHSPRAVEGAGRPSGAAVLPPSAPWSSLPGFGAQHIAGTRGPRMIPPTQVRLRPRSAPSQMRLRLRGENLAPCPLVLPTPLLAGRLDPHSPSAAGARSPVLGGGRDPGLGEGQARPSPRMCCRLAPPQRGRGRLEPLKDVVGGGVGMLGGSQFRRRWKRRPPEVLEAPASPQHLGLPGAGGKNEEKEGSSPTAGREGISAFTVGFGSSQTCV